MCDIYNKDVFKFDKAFVSEIVGKIGKDEMLKWKKSESKKKEWSLWIYF